MTSTTPLLVLEWKERRGSILEIMRYYHQYSPIAPLDSGSVGIQPNASSNQVASNRPNSGNRSLPMPSPPVYTVLIDKTVLFDWDSDDDEDSVDEGDSDDDEDSEDPYKDGLFHCWEGDLSIDSSTAVVPAVLVCLFDEDNRDTKHVRSIEAAVRILSGHTGLQGTLLQRFFGMWTSSGEECIQYALLMEYINVNVETVVRNSAQNESTITRWHTAITKSYARLHANGIVHNGIALSMIGVRGVPVRGEKGDYTDVDPDTVDLCLLYMDEALVPSDREFERGLAKERQEVKGLLQALRKSANLSLNPSSSDDNQHRDHGPR